MPIFIMEIQKLVNKKENKDVFESKNITNKRIKPKYLQLNVKYGKIVMLLKIV